MLEIKGITKNYGYNRINPALDNVSLSFAPGEIVGLFGENGAGKTTLFNCILKYTSYKGEITLDEQLIDHKNIAKIAYGSSNNTFFSQLNILEHKSFYAMNFPSFNESRFDLLVEFFELPTKKQIKNMSQGQKNQIETILALSQGATYILLDEPFVNNDIFNREDFYKLLLGLLQPQESIILASHLIDELKNFVSRVVLLRKGKVLADKTTESLDQERLELISWMKQIYGYENRVARFIEKAERELK